MTSRADAKDFVEPESRITSTLSTLLLRPKPNLPDHTQTFTAPLLQSEAMAIQAKKQRHRMNTSLRLNFLDDTNKTNASYLSL